MNPRSFGSLLVLAAAFAPLTDALVAPGRFQVRPVPRPPLAPAPTRAEDDDDGNARIHRLASTHVPDRDEAVAAFAAQPLGEAALRGAIKGHPVTLDDVAAGRKQAGGELFVGPKVKGANWESGFVADGFHPDVYTKSGQVALRFRTDSAVIQPAYSITDMAERGVLRLKAGAAEQLFRVTVSAPRARSGDADAYLISIGLQTGWLGTDRAPVAVLVDGAPVEFALSKHGIQLVKRLREGAHRISVHVAPEFARDLFEFRYVMVNRL